MRIDSATLITRFLERSGTRHVTGIPGGSLLPLYRALADSTLTHVPASNEQGAAFIAQGMARVSGRAGVCLATAGAGITNTVTALADAKADSVPLLCIAGQVPRRQIGSDAFQEVRTGHIVDTITKAHFEVRCAADLVDLLPEALRIAEAGRPGPVLLEVPRDVQSDTVDIAGIPAAPLPQRAAAAPAADIARAALMIDAARRPVLYLGGGVVRARAQHAAQQLAERAGLPTTTTLMALGTLPPEHPLALGMLGLHGARYSNAVIDECDLLIAVGARFDDRATGRLDSFARCAQVIHIDADCHALGKPCRAELMIEADPGHTLTALADSVTPQLRTRWLARVGELRRQRPLPDDSDPRRPGGLIRTVAAVTPARAAISTDVGQHQIWVAQHYPLSPQNAWLTSGGLGTPGFGLPAAIGAALNLPEHVGAVCFTDDGSLPTNMQEVATLAVLCVNVKIIVLDRGAPGMAFQRLRLPHGGHLHGSRSARPPSACAVAAAFGVPALDLADHKDVRAALRGAFAQPGPLLIRVPIGIDEQRLPMVLPGRVNVDAIG